MVRTIFLAFLALALPFVARAEPMPLTVLYKKDTQTSADRIDPAVQSALQAFDEKFIEAGYRVVQPEPKIYETLDKAQGVVVTFSADAGYSLLLDLVKSKRPYSGTEMTYAEVRIRVRVYHGRNVLASTSGLGSVAYKNAAAEDKAFESAARRAVAKATDAVVERLQAAPVPAQAAAAPSLVVSDNVPPPPESATVSPAGKKWALMVGIADFSHICKTTGICGNPLPGVKVDMQTMKAALSGLGVEGERMTSLFDDKATTANVRKALATLKDATTPDDLVYIYMSTHGIPKDGGLSGFGIPVTYDFTPDRFIDFEEVRTAIGAIGANNVIWINDTCHSGLAAEGFVTVEIGSRDFGIASPGAFDASAAANLRNKNVAILSSATGSQKAADLGERGGLFSSIVAAGIRQMTTAGRPLPAIYSFFKEQVDGKVQSAFRDMCSEKSARNTKLCTQGSQQPVFAAQKDGKLLRM